MSETLIPTMSFRWLEEPFGQFGLLPAHRTLQQRHLLANGITEIWLNVPTMVMTQQENPPLLNTTKEPVEA